MSLASLMHKRDVPFELFDIDIASATERDLADISAAMGLNLSVDEMRSIRSHFMKKGRMPTDVELQSLGQAWSEHCCYKSSKVFLRRHVFSIKHPDVIAKGDAGVMAFDDDYAYALRIESHNHPSAIEPYGGAATGIGGIIRDVLCMGAQPIALVDPLFFGPLDYEGEVPPGMKHPKYLLGGVVAGIRDYGNRLGIPTVSGGVFFDEAYIGNCIVNVGCVGIVKRSELLRNAVRGPGDVLILVGGRTGRDGIHGVTFASAELSEASEEESRGAVQLGDPIMKEPLIHACLEVSSRGLATGMKDLGGGGLSCVVGEIALAGGCGATVDLDLVPLKETELAPWEIWVSESQERMMISASEENVRSILEVFDLWDVPATPIGRVIEDQVVRIRYGGVQVFDLDLAFLTRGPEYCRPTRAAKPKGPTRTLHPKLPERVGDMILVLLSDPNISSKEWVIRQYDHEVRGSTVTKPLQGKIGSRSHGDATVIKPLQDSYKGLAVAVGVNPWHTALNPYRGGLGAIDEMCRNLVAVGARPHSLTDCLNFGNPEKPERLGEFAEAVRGLGKGAKAYGLGAPSGNVSFYNETPKGAALPTPTVMGVGIVEDVRRCVTSDFKRKGDPVYLIGETKREFGGSALHRRFGGRGGSVPNVDVKSAPLKASALLASMREGQVAACHDLSDGGLAVALAEMCIGGDIGVACGLEGRKGRTIEKLFSESHSRWIAEIKADREEEWLLTMSAPVARIGEVGGSSLLITDDSGLIADLDVPTLRDAWREPFWRLLV